MSDHTSHSDCLKVSAVTEAHKKLDPFAGEFKAKVKMWMGPGDPHKSTGVIVNTWELGERFLKQVYTGDSQEGPFPSFEGRGFWGYNTASKKYEGFWIDNASTIMQTEAGDVDEKGTTWEMIGEFTDPKSGQPIQKRSIITLLDHDRHSMETYFKGQDGKEFKGFEIRYERVS